LSQQGESFEIIFTRPRSRKSLILPPPLPGIARVDSIKSLGVTITNKLSFTKHITETLSSCAQSLFALRTLRAHGMPGHALQLVFQSTALAKLRYASPAWWGFTNASDRSRLEGFLRRSIKAGYCSANLQSFADLCVSADERFFHHVITNAEHVLNPLLPPAATSNYNLRKRAHSLFLPSKANCLDECNFMTRMLYRDVY